jgi:hypothetical protein
MLKDQENAWRFARRLHRTYFRKDRIGETAFIKASVMD